MEGRWDRCLWLGNCQGRSFEGTLVWHKLDGWDLGFFRRSDSSKAETFLGTLGQQWGWRSEFGGRQRDMIHHAYVVRLANCPGEVIRFWAVRILWNLLQDWECILELCWVVHPFHTGHIVRVGAIN